MSRAHRFGRQYKATYSEGPSSHAEKLATGLPLGFNLGKDFISKHLLLDPDKYRKFKAEYYGGLCKCGSKALFLAPQKDHSVIGYCRKCKPKAGTL